MSEHMRSKSPEEINHLQSEPVTASGTEQPVSGMNVKSAETEKLEKKKIPHWKKRTWSLHIPPEIYPAAEEALKLPQFDGVRNVLLNSALRAYLRWLYKKGLITTDITRPHTYMEQMQFEEER